MRGFLFVVVLLFPFQVLFSQKIDNQPNNDHLKSLKSIRQLITEDKTAEAKSRLDSLYAMPNLNETLRIRIEILKSYLFHNINQFEKAKEIILDLKPSEIDNSLVLSEYLYQLSKLEDNPRSSKESILKAINLITDRSETGLFAFSHYLNSAGIYYQRLRNYDSAKYYYKSAISHAKRYSDVPQEDLALFYQNLALPNAISKDYETAKRFLLKSTSILNSNASSVNKQKDLARNYNNLGRLYFIMSILDSAEYYYTKSEKLRAKLIGENKSELAILYLNMGGFYSVIANFEKAESYFKKSKNIYERSGRTNTEDFYKANLNLGFNLFQMQRYDEAIPYLKYVINSSFIELKGTAFRHLAGCYHKLGDNEKADSLYQKSIAVLSNSDNQRNLALVYLNYGNFLVQNEQADKAKHYIQKAKNIFTEIFGSKNRDVALTNLSLSKVSLLENDFTLALNQLQNAFSATIHDFNNTSHTSYPDKSKLSGDINIIEIVFQKGRVFLKKYQQTKDIGALQNASEAFKLGIEVAEEMRLKYEYQSNKLTLTEKIESEYDYMLEVLRALYEETGQEKYLSDIFTFMEKSKAAVLLSTITDSKAKLTANIPDSVLNKEKYLRTRINGLKKLIFDERQKADRSNTEKISEWESKVFEIKQQYQAQREYIKENFPEYYKLRLNPETLSLEETINKLDKDQAILEYSILDEKVLILLITKEYQELFISNTPESEIDRMIESIRSNLIVKDFVNFDRKQFRSFVKETNQLYQSLIKPFENKIEDKRLVIIPDGKMGFIPMELLLTEDFNTEKGYMNYKSLPYLIKKHSVSYAYSSTLLHKAAIKEIPSRKKVFAMAPSYDNISRTPVDSLFNHRQKTTLLMPIPGAKQEVENIRKIFRSDSWTGEKATESTFVENATGYAILHLAMHTIVNDENPMYSKLVFYQEEGQEKDNLLNTYELFDLNLNAEMAVLSACNTGYGKLQRGEGIMSLARGFLYAGVPSIVMTLWPIEDAATADIMKMFYENLSDGMQKDDALRKAKLDFLDGTDMLTSHPHFWASFVNIGPSKPLKHTNSSNSTLWWIGGAALLLVLILVWRFKIKS